MQYCRTKLNSYLVALAIRTSFHKILLAQVSSLTLRHETILQGLVQQILPPPPPQHTQQETKSKRLIQNIKYVVCQNERPTAQQQLLKIKLIQEFYKVFLAAIDSQQKCDLLPLHAALTRFLPISYQGSLNQTSHTSHSFNQIQKIISVAKYKIQNSFC